MLQSDIATFQQSAKKSRKQLLSCVEETPSYLTHWKILSFDPQIRMETEGSPVPVCHICTGLGKKGRGRRGKGGWEIEGDKNAKVISKHQFYSTCIWDDKRKVLRADFA